MNSRKNPRSNYKTVTSSVGIESDEETESVAESDVCMPVARENNLDLFFVLVELSPDTWLIIHDKVASDHGSSPWYQANRCNRILMPERNVYTCYQAE